MRCGDPSLLEVVPTLGALGLDFGTWKSKDSMELLHPVRDPMFCL
jgi:hypothetical protein